jgi:hypothetical protein
MKDWTEGESREGEIDGDESDQSTECNYTR